MKRERTLSQDAVAEFAQDARRTLKRDAFFAPGEEKEQANLEQKATYQKLISEDPYYKIAETLRVTALKIVRTHFDKTERIYISNR